MPDQFSFHTDFNEHDYFVDSKGIEAFAEITKKVFGNNLLLAIIESTTISELSSIGTTLYLSYKPTNYIKSRIHKDYIEIINEFKKTSFGSISKYYDWYKREKFCYLIGYNASSNPGEASTSATILNTEILSNISKPPANKYISDYNKQLTEAEIKNFFRSYANRLLKEEWFGELPHYFILIQPVSFKEKIGDVELYKPIGNLYVKIGLNRHIKIRECQKFIHQLKSVWMNHYGGKILKEYSKKVISDEYMPRLEQSDAGTLKNKFDKVYFHIGNRGITLNDFFYYAFDTDKYVDLRNRFLHTANTDLYKQLCASQSKKEQISTIIRDRYYAKDDKENILNTALSGFKSMRDLSEKNIKYFILLLSKRRLALALLFIFGFSLEEIHNTLKPDSRANSSADEAEHAKYLLDLFITTPTKIKKLYSLLAEREKEFLSDLHISIIKKHPEFKCHYSAFT